MSTLTTLASLGMAFGAPLIYADQAWSIQKRRNAEGFSKDVCGVIIIANTCRIFFWFGKRFELALLLQSILLIVAHFYLLSLLLKFRPGSYASSAFSVASGDRGQRRGASSGSTDFAADEQGREQGREREQASRSSGSQQSPAFAALFNGTLGAKAGGYSSLFSLPVAPTLDEEEDDEGAYEAQAHSLPRQQRSSGGSLPARIKAIIQGGLRRQEGILRRDGSSGGRPFGFWTWPNLSSYFFFTGLLVVFLAILQILLGWSSLYVDFLGFFALGLEATLPIPQALKNWQRKSLSGFRITVLIGWTGGDLFKNVYYIIAGSPAQFLICGLFTLVIDVIICAQLYMYREQTARDDEELRLADAEALEAGQREQAPIEDTGARGATRGAPVRGKAAPQLPKGQSRRGENAEPLEASQFQIEADDEDDDADLGRQRR